MRVVIIRLQREADDVHGPAAAMDIGGRKAAAFASGCINSFQYIGAGVAMQIPGRLLERTGYTYFLHFRIPWALAGAILMFSMAKQRNLRKGVGN